VTHSAMSCSTTLLLGLHQRTKHMGPLICSKLELLWLLDGVTAKREKAKREGTCRTSKGINDGCTEGELSKAKELYPREFQQEKQ